MGERQDAPVYETSAYIEAPLSDRLSLVAAPWVEQNYDTVEGWRGEATFAAKRTLRRTDDSAMALQLGALWLSDPGAGCDEGGVELRWLGGVSRFEGAAFFNAEAAARVLSGGCGGARLDLTAGYRPNRRWLGMAQLFYDAPSEREETLKAQLTLVHFRESGRGVQVGLRTRIDSGFTEPALVIAFWGRAGRDAATEER